MCSPPDLTLKADFGILDAMLKLQPVNFCSIGVSYGERNGRMLVHVGREKREEGGVHALQFLQWQIEVRASSAELRDTS
jgi:hypothetical protein